LWIVEILDAGSSTTVTYTFYKKPQRLFFTKDTSNQLVVNVEEITDPFWRDVSQKAYFRAENTAAINYNFSTLTHSGGTIVRLKIGHYDTMMEFNADLGPDSTTPAYVILLADEGKASNEYNHEIHVRPR